MKAVHFGAGNIGRGFIGSILSKAEYDITFVDVNDELIDEINRKGEYTIHLAGRNESEHIMGVKGLNSLSDEDKVIQAISQADLITTAVGPNVLAAIAPIISRGLVEREAEVNVIACENMIGGSNQLKQHVFENLTTEQKGRVEEKVGFPNAAVDRIVPEQNQSDLLAVMVEPYFEWVVETAALKGEQPAINGITFVEDLTPYIERKLFTVNTGHAAAAYLGKLYGHRTIKQAIDDPKIEEKVRSALQESGEVLVEKYNFSNEKHQQYIETTIQRFLNPDLSDEVSRVGRAPIRKLGLKDRLIRPAVEYINITQKSPEILAEVIAAALLYRNPSDKEAVELERMIEKNGPIQTLQSITGIENDHPLLPLVEKKFINLD